MILDCVFAARHFADATFWRAAARATGHLISPALSIAVFLEGPRLRSIKGRVHSEHLLRLLVGRPEAGAKNVNVPRQGRESA
jgi:hypothetical protein